MSSSAPPAHVRRGETVRAALLAVVRRCALEHRPLPRHADLGRVLGINGPSVTRHMNKLLDDGAFTPVQVGRRMYVGGMGR